MDATEEPKVVIDAAWRVEMVVETMDPHLWTRGIFYGLDKDK